MPFSTTWRQCSPKAPLTMGGTWSHFAFADAPDHPTVRAQQERFGEVLRLMEARGIPTGGGAPGQLGRDPDQPQRPLRPGPTRLAIYGLSPVPDLGRPEDFGLREAMRVRARLTTVKRARAGQGVSYAHQYVTDRDTVLGIVPVGYADGVPSLGEFGGAGACGRAHAHRGRAGLHGPVRRRSRSRLRRSRGDVVTLLGVGVAGGADGAGLGRGCRDDQLRIVTRMGPPTPARRGGEA